MIVCHSLGGSIVKQALCVANKQFPRYGSIVNAIAGVMFLSTPHRYGDKITTLIRCRDVFEATTGKTLKIPSASVEQEGAMLLNLADRFEEISLRTPILSVYELRESKNSSSPLLPKHQQVSFKHQSVLKLTANYDSSWSVVKPVQPMLQWKQSLASTLTTTIHVCSQKALELKAYPSFNDFFTIHCVMLSVLLPSDSKTVSP